MDHSKTLTNMSPLTRRGWSYLQGRKNRRLLVTLRVTPEERDAIRAAADYEQVPVAEFHPRGDRHPCPGRVLQGSRQRPEPPR